MPSPTKRKATDPAKVSGKVKVTRVRDELLAERARLLQQIEETIAERVNMMANWRKEAQWARQDVRKASWGALGPEQGNVGRHIDALAAQVYGLDMAINMLNEILGEPTEGSKLSG